METPICDQHKWSKVPYLDADAFILDMEDSASPDCKVLARDRAVQYLGDREYFHRRPLFPRCNHLGTPWGLSDLTALAEAGTDVLVYPKTASAADIERVKEVFLAHGSGIPDIFPCIETAQAVLELESIAQVEGVKGLWFGPADLAVDAGFHMFAGDEVNDAALYYPRMKAKLVAAAYGLPIWEGVIVRNFRDQAAVRQRAEYLRELGFTGMITFYPPHLEVLNDVFTPGAQEVADANALVSAYESALHEGSAAVTLDGRAVIVQDYKRAKELLRRAHPRVGGPVRDTHAN
jgi:citrate lyase beta subunit